MMQRIFGHVTLIDLPNRRFTCDNGVKGPVVAMFAGGAETGRGEIAYSVLLEEDENPKNWCLLFLKFYRGELIRV